MLLAFAAVQTAGPIHAQAPSPVSCSSAPVGRDAFCTVSDGTRLHYVDWGGRGPVIVLLAGLGNSARIFDDLAPRLTRGHRVIAITRRGYGLSADAAGGDYGNARLVRDVLDVMDGLRIHRASFVGHSLAGGELAALGADHPDRVERLVYLDAAYDRSGVPTLMAKMPPLPPPAPADLASLPAMTRWREGALGVRSGAVAADLADVMKAGPTGLTPRTPSSTAAAVLAGDMAAPPRYGLIRAPSLAIYNSKDQAEQVPAGAPAGTREKIMAYSLSTLRPWMLAARRRFDADQPCGTSIELPASGHYLFLERPDWTSGTVLRFLETSTPCRFTIEDAVERKRASQNKRGSPPENRRPPRDW